MSDGKAASAEKAAHVYLIDGSGLIFRAFHSLPPMTRPDGTPVNAVYGFCTMLMKILADTDADHVAVIFDTSRTSFRNAIYPAYKANRPDPPEELVPQFPLFREATRAFNLPCIELEGFEADDLIATYARAAIEAGAEVTVVSSDKDLMQLIRPGVVMFDPMKSIMVGEAEVQAKFGVGPDKVVDVQALAGDSTDNVPGVPGIGVKTAAELIGTYGDLDTLLARAGEIKQPKRRESLLANAELARVSRELVRLRADVPLPQSIESLARHDPDPEVLLAFLRAQGFRSILGRVASQYGSAAPQGAAAAPAAAIDRSGYALVQDPAVLADWVARATAAGIVAVDTETTSLDAMRAELVGVSLALTDGAACYVPLGHQGGVAGQLDLAGDGSSPPQIPLKVALALLKPLLADRAVLKVGQNLKYDMAVLARYGLRIEPFDDTMLLSYVLDGGRHGHGMDELSVLHLGHQPITFAEVTGKGRERISFAQVPLEAARDYAAEDADVTLRLHRVLKPRLVLERMVTLYETIERPLAPILVAMERAGILVDRAQLQGLSRDFGQRMAELEDTIHKLAGRSFNVGSPKQLGEILYDEMGLAGGKKGKTGAYATGADVLEDLAAAGHELPQRVLDWRLLGKLKSTYSDTLVEQINPETGRVHTSYAMAATTTGRLASTDPNLQNIPVRTEEGRKIRRAFIAAPGHVLLSADYSQIELRLLAEIAAIGPLRQAFHDGLDIHALTASQVFGVPIAGMDPAIRRSAKAINFGIIYGMSAFGLANRLGIPQRDAQAYIEAY
ncbi:MAG: DNA polymerase I, partial [Alphaproteobacteria bacterium]|nr:DNA polymerase I [Alphaproteobacteria bacterium]